MADKKLFTVFGATGQQGGALVQYILAHPRFSKIYKLRGVTRDANKPSAKALINQDVEVVEANMDDSVSLQTATKESYVVFAMTNYWDSASRTIETQQGRNLANAAVSSGAHALIWSSLPRIGLPNFESKADVEDYIRTLPIKAVFYMPGWFMQNQLSFARPVKVEDEGVGKEKEKYVLKPLFPGCEADTLVPLIDNDDIGKFVQPFLDDVDALHGKGLTASSGLWTPREMCAVWRKVTGKQIWYEGDVESEDSRDKVDRSDEDTRYYGVGSRKALNWTLAQMEESPSDWQSYVKRVEEKEGWFKG